MAILDKKTTELPALPIPAADDLLRAVDDVAGTPTDKKVVVSDLIDSFTRTAEEISEGVVPLDLKKFPSPIRDISRYVSDNTGASDITTEFQDAIDVTAVNGGEIIVPEGTFLASGLILKPGVYITGPMSGLATQSNKVAAIIKAAGAGTIIETDGVVTNRNCGLIGLGFLGLGAGTAVVGVNFDNCDKGIIKYCNFNNFSDQAIIIDADCTADLIEDNFAQNCLLDRTQVAKVGVIEIRGTDHKIVGGEYTASVTSLSDVNAFLCAVLVEGGEHFFDSIVGEISDVGIQIQNVTSHIKFMQCRADLNFSNGWEIDGSAHLHNCLALRNGQETDNTYDGFVVTSGNGSMVGCQARSLSGDAFQHRFGFNDSQNSDTVKFTYTACRSLGHQTAEFSFQDFAGPGIILPNGAQKSFADADTTPDVSNYQNFRAVNTGATSITTFDGGVSGQRITVQTNNTNTTFVNGSTLKTTTVANKVSVANATYEFILLNAVWFEVGEPIVLQTYTPSNDATDRTWDANAAVSGTGIDVADAGPANVALLSDHDALVTVVQELSDVVATLTKDLTTKGSL